MEDRREEKREERIVGKEKKGGTPCWYPAWRPLIGRNEGGEERGEKGREGEGEGVVRRERHPAGTQHGALLLEDRREEKREERRGEKEKE